jgi:uncharacterized tellurite resistance protein B-like protein
MDKDTAIIHLLANFAYIDNNIAPQEVEVIKNYAKKKNIKADIDGIIKFVVKNANEDELKLYADSLNFLNQNLSADEKLEFLKSANDVIKSDGVVLEGEIIKLQMVAKNWGIDIKKISG